MNAEQLGKLLPFDLSVGIQKGLRLRERVGHHVANRCPARIRRATALSQPRSSVSAASARVAGPRPESPGRRAPRKNPR